MLMDVPAVQGIAGNLRGSAVTVNDAALCVRRSHPITKGQGS